MEIRMKVSGNLICNRCGEQIVGSLTIIPGLTPISVKSDGTVIQQGATEVFWNKQRNISASSDKLWVQCVNDHEWVVNII